MAATPISPIGIDDMAFSRTSTATTAGDIYGLIRAAGAITRTEIGELTGLSRTAVAARVAALADRGLITEREQAPSTGGRPAALLTFNADAGVVLAAAIGRSRTRLAVCNLAGEILAAGDIDQEIGIGPDELMPDVVKRLDVLLDGHRDARIHGVGLCLPGTVDQHRGCSLDSPIMSGWDGVPLAPYFAELTDAPVILDNDVNVIALAERRGDRQAVDDVLRHQGLDGSRSRHHRRRVRYSAARYRRPGSSVTTRRPPPTGCRADAATPAAWKRSRAVGRWCGR